MQMLKTMKATTVNSKTAPKAVMLMNLMAVMHLRLKMKSRRMPEEDAEEDVEEDVEEDMMMEDTELENIAEEVCFQALPTSRGLCSNQQSNT